MRLWSYTKVEKVKRNKKNPQQCAGFSYLAESEGFEPPVGLTPRLISSQVH